MFYLRARLLAAIKDSARLGSLETVKYNAISSLERYQGDINQTQDGLFNVEIFFANE